MARITWICTALALLLLLYNLTSLWSAPSPAYALGPTNVRARMQARPTQATAAVVAQTADVVAPTAQSLPAARTPGGGAVPRSLELVRGAPVALHFQPTTPSVCAPKGPQRNVPVTPRPLNYVPARACDPAADGAAFCDALRQAGVTDGAGSAVLLVVVSRDDARALSAFVQRARAAGAGAHLLVAALDSEAAAAARALSPPPAVWEVSAVLSPGLPPPARKWELSALLVSRGVSVFYSAVEVSLSADPFAALFHDADLEVAGDARGGGGLGSFFDSGGVGGDRGGMRVAMDSIMGWSQMCESYQISPVSPHFWFAAATHESLALLRRLSSRLRGGLFGAEGLVAGGMVWPAASAEAYLLTEEALAPAHDGVTRAGTSLRVLESRCLGSRGAELASGIPAGGHGAASAAIKDVLEAHAFLARPQVPYLSIYIDI